MQVEGCQHFSQEALFRLARLNERWKLVNRFSESWHSKVGSALSASDLALA
jgi:hypothetical protein